MIEPICLRPYRSDEIETLRRIESNARKRYATLNGFETVATAPAIAAERFAAGKTMVAEAVGSPLGYVLFHPLDGLLYIASIAVSEDASGQGVGQSLLETACFHAKRDDLPALVLTTFRTPRWNAPWFRKHGFASMPQERIGTGLQTILDRHATFLDMSMRETLWHPLTL